MPICKKHKNTGIFYLVDVLYKKKHMDYLYDEIIARIINHGINIYLIENNTDTSLRALIDTKLRASRHFNCKLEERYETANKEKRIKFFSASIIQGFKYKDKSLYTASSDYGKFMQQLTSYSFEKANKFDDAPDGMALFARRFISERGKPQVLIKPKSNLYL